MSDQIDCCLNNRKQNDLCGGDKPSQLSCYNYASSRCSQVWDDKCDMYLNEIDAKKNRISFLDNVIRQKYCKLHDKSQCFYECESFNPMVSESCKVCHEAGTEVLRDSNNNFVAENGCIVNQGPYKEYPCKYNCSANLKQFQKDPLIDLCAKYNACHDVIHELCKDSNVDSSEIAHPYVKMVLQTDEDSQKKMLDSSDKQDTRTSLMVTITEYCKQNSNLLWTILLILLVIALILQQ